MKLRLIAIIFSIASAFCSLNAQDLQTNDDFGFGSEEKSDQDSFEVIAVEGGLEINVPEDQKFTFLIFSITGQMIKKADVVGSGNRIELQKGCYIVKCGKWSKKLVVR